MNKYLVLSATALLLSACGGGGGGSTASDVSVGFSSINVADGSAPKRIEFSWAVDDASNVDEFVLLENADGSSGFTEVARVDGSETSLEYELSVHLTDWINAEYIVEARTALDAKIGSSDEVNLTQALSAQATGYLKASSASEFGNFGQAVVVSGDGTTMAIGAPGDKAPTNPLDPGAVYIFKNLSGAWVQTLKLTPNTRIDRDRFGTSVALSDDGLTIAVGVPLADDQVPGIGTGNSTNTGAPNAGAVYVYTLAENGSARSDQVYIKASNPDPTGGDNFGHTVSLTQNGSWLAVGSPQEDSVAEDSGAVYVFERDNAGTWTQNAVIKASNAGAFDKFGSSVAITEGATKRFLAVGAPGESSNGTRVNGGAESNDLSTRAGAVYVYEDSGSGWPIDENFYIKASNTGANDEFGAAVALSNSGVTLAVGAPNEQDDEGAMYVFRRDTTFGYAQSAFLKASNAEANDFFGYSVSLSGDGNTLAVGARAEDALITGINGDSENNEGGLVGAAYVFTRSNGIWSQQSYVKASNARDDDEFGNSVSLSGDGGVLAVGASRESGDASGIDGTLTNTTVLYSGAVYLY